MKASLRSRLARANELLPHAGTLDDGATTPPSDGFSEATANDYGAFRDENDDQATGLWFVRNDR